MSNQFRVLTDKKGNKFRFNSIAFADKVEEVTQKHLIEDVNGKHYVKTTKKDLFLKIADKCFVDFESVRKWYAGKNGPGSIDMVKACASVLNIDSLSLLVQLTDDKECTMNQADYELINEIFERCLQILYDYAGLQTTKEYKALVSQSDLQRQFWYDFKEKKYAEVEQLFFNINRTALKTSESIRSRLKRILMDMNFILENSTSEIERFRDFYLDTAFDYYTETREEAIRARDWIPDGYIYEEIDFAESIGLFDNKEPGDDFYEQLEALSKEDDDGEAWIEYVESFGNHTSYYDIKPSLVSKHMIQRELTNLFKHDFPELSEYAMLAQ